jgi:hypothetical protein
MAGRPKPAKRVVSKALLEWVVSERDRACLYGFVTGEGCFGGLDPHHIIPRSQGGNDVKENIITLCRGHHDQAEDHIIKPEELKGILGRIYGYGL